MYRIVSSINCFPFAPSRSIKICQHHWKTSQPHEAPKCSIKESILKNHQKNAGCQLTCHYQKLTHMPTSLICQIISSTWKCHRTLCEVAACESLLKNGDLQMLGLSTPWFQARNETYWSKSHLGSFSKPNMEKWKMIQSTSQYNSHFGSLWWKILALFQHIGPTYDGSMAVGCAHIFWSPHIFLKFTDFYYTVITSWYQYRISWVTSPLISFPRCWARRGPAGSDIVRRAAHVLRTQGVGRHHGIHGATPLLGENSRVRICIQATWGLYVQCSKVCVCIYIYMFTMNYILYLYIILYIYIYIFILYIYILYICMYVNIRACKTK